MSDRGKFVLRGHALVSEGAPHDERGIKVWGYLGEGRALCRCGAMSDVLPSTNARKRWHRAHKGEILALQQRE